MAGRKFSIFISSTYEDLLEERQALIGVALERGYIPVGMEQFHAAPASQWDVITKMIDECDFYLVMIGGRYGSIDDTVGISYTEKEYDYAKNKGIPVLGLIRKAEAITNDKIDKGEGWKEKQEKLENLRKRVEDEDNTVDYFTDVNDLKYRASATLSNAVNYCRKGAGWIRYSDAEEYINEKVREGVEAKQEIENKQNETLAGMKTMLVEFSSKLDLIKETQEANVVRPITTNEIDDMFGHSYVENGTLHLAR